jgi:predicted dinucleotide-binding enzyme
MEIKDTKKKVGVVGKGNVAKALARGLERAGHHVKVIASDAPGVRDVADWSEIVFIAAPVSAVDAIVKTAADALDGKTVVDLTNALDAGAYLEPRFVTSGGEELQRSAPKARVVKAFNVILAQTMETGRAGGQALTALVAGDDAGAKRVVLDLVRELGFDALDAGPLKNARLLESMPVLTTQLCYFVGLGAHTAPTSCAGPPAA